MAQHTNTHWIGRRLAAARQCRGWALVDELAARTGITRRRLACSEATGDLSCDDLETLAAALRLPVGYFLGACVLCGVWRDSGC